MKNISEHINTSINEGILDADLNGATKDVATSQKLRKIRMNCYHNFNGPSTHGFDSFGIPVKEGDFVIAAYVTEDNEYMPIPVRLVKSLDPDETEEDRYAWLTDISAQEADKIFPSMDPYALLGGYYIIYDEQVILKIDKSVVNKMR